MALQQPIGRRTSASPRMYLQMNAYKYTRTRCISKASRASYDQFGTDNVYIPSLANNPANSLQPA